MHKISVDVSTGEQSITQLNDDEIADLVLQTNAAVTMGLKSLLAEVRAARLPVLDALMGIAGRKHRGNKKDIADAIDIAAQGLLDLPSKPSVQAATDEASLRLALKNEYEAIVLALATACGTDWLEVQAAFREYEL